jgi:3-isopropylmalate/(R)-2-methylmalate dehydratase small subunit
MPDIHKPMRGRVWKFGDSVDTSQLAKGGSQIADDEDMRGNCLRALRPEFSQQVKEGDFLVAGKNFGCGSSRQTAVQALQACGIQAVLAESVARIYRRNSIALALPTFAIPGISELVNDGDELELDYDGRLVKNISNGRQLALDRFPKSVEQIYELGGICEVIVKKLAGRGIVPG